MTGIWIFNVNDLPLWLLGDATVEGLLKHYRFAQQKTMSIAAQPGLKARLFLAVAGSERWKNITRSLSNMQS